MHGTGCIWDTIYLLVLSKLKVCAADLAEYVTCVVVLKGKVVEVIYCLPTVILAQGLVRPPHTL